MFNYRFTKLKNELLGTVHFGFHISLFPPFGAGRAACVRRQKAEEATGFEGNDCRKKQMIGISSSVSQQIFYFCIIQN